jgi:4'-phosphopantetheinyl transferase
MEKHIYCGHFNNSLFEPMSTQIFFVEISAVHEPKIDDLMKLVSKERRIQLAKLRFEIDRKLSLYAELLVRYYIDESLGIKNREAVLLKSKNGKPYLQGHSEFQFNISHTFNAIAVAFSNNVIGIDIERIKPPDFKIAERFFTFAEQSYIFSHENPKRAFYEIWTKKEAYIKYLGTGLSAPLRSINTLDNIKTIYTFEIEKYIISICYEETAETQRPLVILTEIELHSLLMRLLAS